MSKQLVVLTAVFALMAGSVFAQNADITADETINAGAVATEDAASASTATEVNNTVDPITGEDITVDNELKVEFNGKIYNFTARGKEEFEKNPGQYEEKLAAAAGVQAAPAEDAGTLDAAVPAEAAPAESAPAEGEAAPVGM